MLSITVQETELVFEHSLVSLSKWEEKHEKPFFAWNEEDSKTNEEMLSYFECMLVSPPPDFPWLTKLTNEDALALVNYINKPATATIVREVQSKPGKKENVTSELVYYWMIAFEIDWRAESWHLNRLMTLIRVCGAKQAPPEKVAPTTRAQQYREMNEARKKKLGTKG